MPPRQRLSAVNGAPVSIDLLGPAHAHSAWQVLRPGAPGMMPEVTSVRPKRADCAA